MIEQLHRTEIRVAKETAVGSGVAEAPGWVYPGMTAAAVGRNIIQMAEQRDPWRQLRRREIISNSWMFRTSHEVGLPFLRWILQHHLTARGGGLWTLDPEAPGASFVVETKSEGGDLAAYSGCKVAELQIVWEDRRTIKLELTWIALRRTVLEEALPGDLDPADIEGPMVPTWTGAFAVTTGAWEADPRVDQAAVAHGGQVFLTREIDACNYGADGIPSDHTRAPWKCVGEVFTPETPGLTDTAFADEWVGKVALWIGAGTEHVRINNAVGFIGEEDLKAYDWRVRRIAFEGMTDPWRSIMEFRA